MPPTKHSKQEEDAFMDDLFTTLDATQHPTFPKSPVRPRTSSSHVVPLVSSPNRQSPRTPTKPKRQKVPVRAKTPKTPLKDVKDSENDIVHIADDVNIDEELAGWDWDAVSDYVPTPQKPQTSKQKVRGRDVFASWGC